MRLKHDKKGRELAIGDKVKFRMHLRGHIAIGTIKKMTKFVAIIRTKRKYLHPKTDKPEAVLYKPVLYNRLFRYEPEDRL